jgi:hypothetical protein
MLPSGRQRGAFYPADQVTAVIHSELEAKRQKQVKKRRASHSAHNLRSTAFLKATCDDTVGITDLLAAVFGGRPNPERLAQWLQRNPDIAYILKSDGNIVGCGFILPLKEEKILDILHQDTTPPTYPDEILLFEPGVPTCLYVRSVCIQQEGVSRTQRRNWGSQLVRDLMKVILDLGLRGITLERIYTRSDTPDGERLSRHMGFTEIVTSTWHRNFMIDAATSGLDAIVAYKRSLAKWRQANEGEII